MTIDGAQTVGNPLCYGAWQLAVLGQLEIAVCDGSDKAIPVSAVVRISIFGMDRVNWQRYRRVYYFTGIHICCTDRGNWQRLDTWTSLLAIVGPTI